MLGVLPNVIPIILLLSLGYFMKVKKILKQTTIDEINKFVVNVSIPALIFFSFKTMELKIEHLPLTLIIFLFLLIIYIMGEGLNRIRLIHNPIMPFLLPVFANGTLGIPLYLSVFGIENLSSFTILILGHDLFVWFFLTTIIKLKLRGEGFSSKTIIDFIKNPYVIAISLGIIINLTGFDQVIQKNHILLGIENFAQYLNVIASPLILIIVGYGFNIDKRYLKASGKILAVRIPLILITGYVIKFLFIDKIIIDDKFFNYAWFTYLILPPSYVVALLVGNYGSKEDKEIAVNTIVMATIICIIVYVIFALFFL